jgi:cytochrome c
MKSTAAFLKMRSIMKWLFPAVIIVFTLACNTQTEKSKAPTPTDSLINTAGGVADPAYQAGARLVARNDCLTCHMLDKKSIGPSYYQISQKYPFDTGVVENLAHSIIHGSKGLYGSNEMPGHPTLNYNDAKAMATYILSLKHVPKAQQGGK